MKIRIFKITMVLILSAQLFTGKLWAQTGNSDKDALSPQLQLENSANILQKVIDQPEHYYTIVMESIEAAAGEDASIIDSSLGNNFTEDTIKSGKQYSKSKTIALKILRFYLSPFIKLIDIGNKAYIRYKPIQKPVRLAEKKKTNNIYHILKVKHLYLNAMKEAEHLPSLSPEEAIDNEEHFEIDAPKFWFAVRRTIRQIIKRPITVYYPGSGGDILSVLAATDGDIFYFLDKPDYEGHYDIKDTILYIQQQVSKIQGEVYSITQLKNNEIVIYFNYKNRVRTVYVYHDLDAGIDSTLPKRIKQGFDVYFEKALTEGYTGGNTAKYHSFMVGSQYLRKGGAILVDYKGLGFYDPYQFFPNPNIAEYIKKLNKTLRNISLVGQNDVYSYFYYFGNNSKLINLINKPLFITAHNISIEESI